MPPAMRRFITAVKLTAHKDKARFMRAFLWALTVQQTIGQIEKSADLRLQTLFHGHLAADGDAPFERRAEPVWALYLS